MTTLHLATRVFLAGYHISDDEIKSRKVEEKRKSMRQAATKFEKFKRRKPRSREAKEGEEEKISMKIIVKLREIERETKHLCTMVSFQVSLMFSFLIITITIFSNLIGPITGVFFTNNCVGS